MPLRVGFVHAALVLPSHLSPERLASIRRAVDHCTVYQSLRRLFEVAVSLLADSVAVSLLADSATVPAMAPLNADAAAIMAHAGPAVPDRTAGLQ